MPLCHFLGKNVWILKPTSMNRGQGIHVANSFKKIKKLVREYCRGRDMDQSVSNTSKELQVPPERCSITAEIVSQIMAMNESVRETEKKA